jgi:hypothetical protein
VSQNPFQKTNPQITQMAADSKDKQTHAIIGAVFSDLRKSAKSAD